jgi:hypothetical protein
MTHNVLCTNDFTACHYYFLIALEQGSQIYAHFSEQWTKISPFVGICAVPMVPRDYILCFFFTTQKRQTQWATFLRGFLSTGFSEKSPSARHEVPTSNMTDHWHAWLWLILFKVTSDGSDHIIVTARDLSLRNCIQRQKRTETDRKSSSQTTIDNLRGNHHIQTSIITFNMSSALPTLSYLLSYMLSTCAYHFGEFLFRCSYVFLVTNTSLGNHCVRIGWVVQGMNLYCLSALKCCI